MVAFAHRFRSPGRIVPFQTTDSAGEIVLTAAGDGLETQRLTIESEHHGR